MHSMRGKIFMNQITLNVKLFANGPDEDILAFLFEDAESRVNLNTDSCQAELKDVFSRLIKLSLNNDVSFNLIIEDSYGRGLYKDVCTEYIAELQRELDSVKDKIRREIATD